MAKKEGAGKDKKGGDEGEEVYIPPAGGTRRRTKEERDAVTARMYAYWNEFYQRDTESKIARALIENLQDPESMFHDEDFLQRYIDEIEQEKGVENSRWKVKK